MRTIFSRVGVEAERRLLRMSPGGGPEQEHFVESRVNLEAEVTIEVPQSAEDVDAATDTLRAETQDAIDHATNQINSLGMILTGEMYRGMESNRQELQKNLKTDADVRRYEEVVNAQLNFIDTHSHEIPNAADEMQRVKAERESALREYAQRAAVSSLAGQVGMLDAEAKVVAAESGETTSAQAESPEGPAERTDSTDYSDDLPPEAEHPLDLPPGEEIAKKKGRLELALEGLKPLFDKLGELFDRIASVIERLADKLNGLFGGKKEEAPQAKEKPKKEKEDKDAKEGETETPPSAEGAGEAGSEATETGDTIVTAYDGSEVPVTDPETVKKWSEYQGMRTAREGLEKEAAGTPAAYKGIVGAIETEVNFINEHAAEFVESGLIEPTEVQALQQKGKEYVDKYNVFVREAGGAETKDAAVKLLQESVADLLQRIDMRIGSEQSVIENKQKSREEGGWFGGLKTWVTGSDPYQSDINRAGVKIRSLENMKESVIKRLQDELAKPADQVNLEDVLDDLKRAYNHMNTVLGVDIRKDHWEVEEQAIGVTRDVSIAVITLPAAFVGGPAAGMSGGFRQAAMIGMRQGALEAGLQSGAKNYDAVSSGEKTVGEAVRDTAIDTTVGAGLGAGAGAGAEALTRGGRKVFEIGRDALRRNADDAAREGMQAADDAARLASREAVDAARDLFKKEVADIQQEFMEAIARAGDNPQMRTEICERAASRLQQAMDKAGDAYDHTAAENFAKILDNVRGNTSRTGMLGRSRAQGTPDQAPGSHHGFDENPRPRADRSSPNANNPPEGAQGRDGSAPEARTRTPEGEVPPLKGSVRESPHFGNIAHSIKSLKSLRNEADKYAKALLDEARMLQGSEAQAKRLLARRWSDIGHALQEAADIVDMPLTSEVTNNALHSAKGKLQNLHEQIRKEIGHDHEFLSQAIGDINTCIGGLGSMQREAASAGSSSYRQARESSSQSRPNAGASPDARSNPRGAERTASPNVAPDIKFPFTKADLARAKGTPHSILGVPRTASSEELRAAYKKLATEWHPDKFSAELAGPANEAMSVINAAKDALKKRGQW